MFLTLTDAKVLSGHGHTKTQMEDGPNIVKSRSCQRTRSDGGHKDPMPLLLDLSLLPCMLLYAYRDFLSLDYCKRRSKPSFFICPQGPLQSFSVFTYMASIATINKLLDMRRNLTCAPTLSYDKGVAFS